MQIDGEEVEAVTDFILLGSKITVSHHFMQIDGEEVEAVTDFILLGSKITVDGDCSHKIKRHLLFGRKAMTNLDRALKSRNITLPTKVRVAFPVVVYGSESWTINKAEC